MSESQEKQNMTLEVAHEPLFKRLWHSFIKRMKDYFKPEGIQEEMLRYKNNTLSGTFGYLSLVCLIGAFCTIYTSTKVGLSDNVTILGLNSSGFWAGFDVVVNILLMLFMFLAISRMRNYSRNWGIVAIVIGAFQIVRPFIYPLVLLQNGILNAGSYTGSLICFIVSGVSFIFAGFLSIYRGAALRKYLKTVKPIENEKASVK